MYNCKICNKEYKNLRSFSSHLYPQHKIKTLDYFIEYENFQKPKCIICDKNTSYKSGLTFRKTCGSEYCIIEERKRRKHSEETKKIISKKRLKYMKENPGETTWRKRNQLSWPEKYFINAVEENGLLDKFEIEREKSFFPYYADFAFINDKVVIEIQGKQHYEEPKRIENDKKKKKLILSKGWSIYYINANQVMDKPNECIRELLNFIGDVENPVKTSRIKTSKEAKDEIKKEEIKRKNEEKEKLKNKFIKDYNSIEKTWGWVRELSNKWRVSHTTIGRWIKKYEI